MGLEEWDCKAERVVHFQATEDVHEDVVLSEMSHLCLDSGGERDKASQGWKSGDEG